MYEVVIFFIKDYRIIQAYNANYKSTNYSSDANPQLSFTLNKLIYKLLQKEKKRYLIHS